MMQWHKNGKHDPLTESQGFVKVAEGNDLKPKVVRIVIAAYLDFATELKKHGKFKLGGVLDMELEKTPARAARKGVNPSTKEQCVFKAKPVSKTVRVLLMKKLKEAIN